MIALAAYAVPPTADSRNYPEKPDEFRSGFQRDRDRILHCSAFRRLDFKTQVFVPHEYDHFRTRLTHSLEVSQIGRDVGRALGLNEDLIEAVALAHDLGHPPFGHIGEKVLDELMASYGHFEHNRQSLRVVDYLEHPYPSYRGLNLTQMTRICLAKHETRYDSPADNEFTKIRFAPLEGQLVDLADEIAYTTADLEDALEADWLSMVDLNELELWRQAWATVEAEYPDARKIHKRIRSTKKILNMMAVDAITYAGEKLSGMKPASYEKVMDGPQKIITFSPDMEKLIAPLHALLMGKVYCHSSNMLNDEFARVAIMDLFCYFTTNPGKLPQRYLVRVEDGCDSLQRVICDYLAGMTDRFCRNLYDSIKLEKK
ncbi:MAG TPA: dNTP triphosphohydrolase [Phycisphaerae bacterium]|nr:dNTP triphosphohydrolase [Phycisphaerae bacterium]HPS52524.1 dNTP triphosphohydrolase [Phycisphaerae bacterium]